ncbi:MFS transporter [Aspergillus insuetus]
MQSGDNSREKDWKAWFCVLGAFCSLFATFGFLNAIGVFQATYRETSLKNYTSSEISWIFAVQLALMWAPGSFFGRLVDVYGPTRIMVPCSLLCVFSLCMTSLSRQYYQIFLSQGLGFGIGAGGNFTASMVCIGQWFVGRRGLATGIAMSGSSLGGVIFPIFFTRVKEAVGFDSAIRYTALIIGVFLAAACLLVTSPLSLTRWNTQQTWFQVSLFRDYTFSLYTAAAFFIMWGIWAPFDYLPEMAQQQGITSSMSLYLISIINGTSLPGRILPAYLGDRLGLEKVIVSAASSTGLTILCLWLPFEFHHSHTGVIVFAAIYGFVSGAFISLLIPFASRAGSLETLGQRIGAFQTVLGVSNLTGLPILGAILGRQHATHFWGLILFAFTSITLGTALLLVAIVIGRHRFKGSREAA